MSRRLCKKFSNQDKGLEKLKATCDDDDANEDLYPYHHHHHFYQHLCHDDDDAVVVKLSCVPLAFRSNYKLVGLLFFLR